LPSDPPALPDEERFRWPARVTVAAREIEHSAASVVNRLELDSRLPARLYDAQVVTLDSVERGDGHLDCVSPDTRRPTRFSAAMLSPMENHG
jgi:hypothetical protein